MTPEMEIDMSQWYCNAGFAHALGADCEHALVSQGPVKRTFALPEDYYEPEALATRRAENKRKYGPGARRPSRGVLIGNEATEVGEW